MRDLDRFEHTVRLLARSCLLGAALGGCADPLDVVGVGEAVWEREQEDLLADDVLEDKQPEYDASRIVEEEFDGCPVTLNKSDSVARLSITDLEGDDAVLDGKLYASRKAALEALGSRPVMVSMEVVNAALKPFNDGLYAAVELGAEDGSGGSSLDKRQTLRDLLSELVERANGGDAVERPLAEQAAEWLGAALLLGGDDPVMPDALATRSQDLVTRFTTLSPLFSKPIGFYTWSPALERIFTRDRLLQRPHVPGAEAQQEVSPPSGALALTALALAQTPELADRYRQVLQLYARLTAAPFDSSPLDLTALVPDLAALSDPAAIETSWLVDHPRTFPDAPHCNPGWAWLPVSEAPENRILRRLLCVENPATGTHLLDQLIRAIQTGALDLAPPEGAGWYDHQIFALETLLVPDRAPETEHLLLTREYKEKLVETFKSILIQTRETHAKELGMANAAPVSMPSVPREFDLYPQLAVEPFATFYLRTARAYRFVDGVLRASLGDDFVDGVGRMLEDGSRMGVTLGQELREKILLLYGLHVVAAESIGSKIELGADEELEFPGSEARASALGWLASWRSAPDIHVDPRVSVPVAIEEDGAQVYWGVIGIKVLRVHASYPESRRPRIVDIGLARTGQICVHRGWTNYEPYVLVEETMEARRGAGSPPLDREEFRALCDRCSTKQELIEAFEASP